MLLAGVKEAVEAINNEIDAAQKMGKERRVMVKYVDKAIFAKSERGLCHPLAILTFQLLTKVVCLQFRLLIQIITNDKSYAKVETVTIRHWKCRSRLRHPET